MSYENICAGDTETFKTDGICEATHVRKKRPKVNSESKRMDTGGEYVNNLCLFPIHSRKLENKKRWGKIQNLKEHDFMI